MGKCISVSLAVLSRDEAEQVWQDDFNLPLESRLARAYFETAFRVSGGLPVAFARAAGYARNRSGDFSPDLPLYKAELVRALPELFERILRYDVSDTGEAVARAVAGLYLRRATTAEKQTILSHRWSMLMVENDGMSINLKSEALGKKALEMIRRTAGPSENPVVVYREGDYDACLSWLEQAGRPVEDLLRLACELMSEATEGGTNNCYFGPRVNWRRVEELAGRGARQLDNPESRAEFLRWGEIAKASYHDDQNAHNVGLRIGLRLIAVTRDSNP